jgi:hypothetical protein
MPEKKEQTSQESSNGGNGHQSVLLSTVLTRRTPVETQTDDFLEEHRELKPEEFRKAFDQKVGGHSGFSASIRRTPKP